ncbi:MAG: hypothetical protein ACK5M1_05095, partial [Xanthomarina gelatinilytica]
LKRKYESLAGRMGKKKALVAVGHKIIVAAYFIILNKETYKEQELHYKPKKRKKQSKYYLNRINQFGISDQQLNQLLELRILGRIFTGLQFASSV